MISTTLMTFLFQAPASTITVELVGSWDRFTKSYPLKRDKRTGPGHWRGCHTFTNITCDGDSLDMSSSRDGGLKMGGKYWYFYRLDGDIENYNPVEPSTNQCPFLPGQHVNILDVPVQAIEPHHQYGSSDAMGSEVYTLDPEAKYIKPRPFVHRTPLYSSLTDIDIASAAALPGEALQSTVTASHKKNNSSAVYRQSARSSSSALSAQKPQSSGSPTKRMLLAAFCKMRVTRSAGFTIRSDSEREQRDHPPILEQSISEAHYTQITKLGPTEYDADVSAAKFPVASTTQDPRPSFSGQHDGKPVLPILDRLPSNEQLSSLCLERPDDQAALSVATEKNFRSSNLPYSNSLDPVREDDSVFEELPINKERLSLVSATIESASILNSWQTDTVTAQVSPGVNHESHLPFDEIYDGAQSCSGSDSPSYTTSNFFSPGLAPGSVNTDGMSPYHLSQPDTPSISEFGGDLLETTLVSNREPYVTLPNFHGPKNLRIGSTANLHDTEYPELEGFQGYRLSETEQASALTLRKFPSIALESRGGDAPFGKQASKDLVHFWNDGSGHRITALEELVDDLGYLGELIV